MTPTHLVLGAGYLAPYLYRALPATARILAVRRHWRQRPDDARVEALACDLTRDDDRARLRARLAGFTGTVYFTLPPSALGDAAGRVLAPLAAGLAASGAARVVVASSTGIWADSDDGVIDERTPVQLASARTRRLAAIEAAWGDAGLPSVAVRLAGLWGAGRIIGRDTLRDGRPVAGAPAAWLNLVRAEDAARALVAAGELEDLPAVLVVSDGRPLRRGDYYAALAAALGVAAPVFDGGPQVRGGGGRRCDPGRSWQRLGCAPAFDDVAGELAALLAAADGA
ncbi:MAG: hypothetical protein H6977_01245 [Gammaproteobacteria bacterium]|nr:hypothetical protein [Gammaproteobacteria bacterium]